MEAPKNIRNSPGLTPTSLNFATSSWPQHEFTFYKTATKNNTDLGAPGGLRDPRAVELGEGLPEEQGDAVAAQPGGPLPKVGEVEADGLADRERRAREDVLQPVVLGLEAQVVTHVGPTAGRPGGEVAMIQMFTNKLNLF